MAITVGSVYVDILPSTDKFAGQVGSQIDPIIKAMAKKIAEELGKAIGRGVSEGVEDGVADADPGDEAAQQGTKTGGKFAQSFKRTLEATLNNLPKIKLDADTKPALRNVAALREQIDKLKASVEVDVDPKKALAGLEKLQRELEFILRSSDVEIDIKVGAAAALAEVEKLRAEIANSLKRSSADAGKFARELNAKLTAAIKAIPKIDLSVNANLSSAEIALSNIRRRVEELSGKRIDIDISVEDAVAAAEAELRKLQALLDRDDLRASVRVNTGAAVAELEAFIAGATGQEIEVPVTPNLGTFNTRLKAQLAAIAASIKPIEIEADTTRSRARIEEIRREISTLSGRIGVDIDTGAALARIKILERELTLLARDRRVEVEVRADTGAAVAELAALAAAAKAAGDSGSTHFSRWQLILAAVVGLFPLIAAAILALPGLLAAVVAPVAAIALGFDGIKTAVAPLAPLFAQLKTEISGVFSSGLGPTISAFKELFDVAGPGLKQTAIDIVSVANGIAQTAASSGNLKTISANFDLINKSIAAAGPWLNQLTTNLVNLVNIGASALPTFQAQMVAVGEAWRLVIERLQATGVGKAAVEGLFSVLTSLLTLLAPMVELGAQMAAGFGPALSGAIDLLTVALQALSRIFSIMPGFVSAMVSSLVLLLGVLGLLGKLPATIAIQLTAMRLALIATATAGTAAGGGFAAAGAGALAFGRALGLLLLNPIVLAIAGISAALYLLSSAQGDASAAAANHASFVSNLTAQLQTTNGVITDSTRAWVVASEEWKVAAAGTKEMGISLSFMTDAALGNEDALNRMRTQLELGVRAHKQFGVDVFNNRAATEYWNIELDDSGEKIRDSLIALNGMADGMKSAQQATRDAADALKEQGISLVNGVASASQYKDSIKKIGDEMSTTSDRANGLKVALDILSGRQLTLLEANANYSDAIRTMGTDFAKFLEQIKAGNTSFTDSAGRINVASEAGAKYAHSLTGIAGAATTAAAAAFDAAGGVGNLTTSVPAAVQKIDELRQIFIKQAEATGLSEIEAKKLADSIGLMPAVTELLFSSKGVPQVQQDMLVLQTQMQLLTKDHPITVNALTDQAAAALDALGFKIEKIPGTTQTKITIEDAEAKTKFAALIKEITTGETTGGPPKVTPTIDGSDIPGGMATVKQTIEGAPPAGVKTTLDTTKVPEQVGILRSEVGQPVTTGPTTLDTAPVAGDVAGIQQTVLGTVAAMPVNIIKGSGWDADIIAIRDSVLATVGSLPINPIKGSGWDADLLVIKSSVTLTVATMPVNPIKNATFDLDLLGLKTLVGQMIAIMPVDVAKSINFDLQLAAIKAALLFSPFAQLPIDVVKSVTFDINLQTIKSAINLAPVIIIVDADTTLATGKVNVVLTSIRATIAVFKVDASTELAINRLFTFWDGLAKVVAFFQVTADVTPAIQVLDALFAAIQQTVVPFTVVAVFGGFAGGILGGATGGVVSGGGGGGTTDPGGAESFGNVGAGTGAPPSSGPRTGPFFDPSAPLDTGNIIDARKLGGVFFKAFAQGDISSLTPMGKVASVVPPNTWRVIGDRMTDDESFIPINNSSRSKSILALTASRMGFGLAPMAQGGVQTQQVGAMAPMAAQGTSNASEGSTISRSSNGDTYTFNITNSSADAYELADEALFRLRYQKFGGTYSGRR